MPIYQDEQDLEEEKKKRQKALKGVQPKIVDDVQHTIKSMDAIDMGEPCYDRQGNIKKCDNH